MNLSLSPGCHFCSGRRGFRLCSGLPPTLRCQFGALRASCRGERTEHLQAKGKKPLDPSAGRRRLTGVGRGSLFYSAPAPACPGLLAAPSVPIFLLESSVDAPGIPSAALVMGAGGALGNSQKSFSGFGREAQPRIHLHLHEGKERLHCPAHQPSPGHPPPKAHWLTFPSLLLI